MLPMRILRYGLPTEYELNRKWIINEDNDATGITGFVISRKFLNENFRKCPNKYDSITEFLDTYEPETDGQFLYELALRTNNLIADTGIQSID